LHGTFPLVDLAFQYTILMCIVDSWKRLWGTSLTCPNYKSASGMSAPCPTFAEAAYQSVT
jgi:hypothetical protein